MNHYSFRLSTTVLLFLITILVSTITPQSSEDLFPDTPENRVLVSEAYKQYLEIDRIHGHFIEVNGIKMHYLEWGDSSGVPLIWSHGYSSSGFELGNVAESLIDSGYHVYSITYRGHGQTQVEDYNFSLEHIADDIVELMNQLHIKKAVIGGLSMGGGVSTAFYDNYPERVIALVLEDGGADVVQSRLETEFLEIKEKLEGYEWPKVQTVFDERFLAYKYIASWYLPGWGGSFPKGTEPLFHSWVRSTEDGKFKLHYDNAKLLGDGLPSIDPAQNHNVPLFHQSWRRINPFITYRNLSVPMLIINPTGDDFDPSADFEKLRDMHPNLVKIIDYPNTPHAAHPMRSEWFVRDMTDLLKKIKY
ncbi:MAG: alpha/beta hydrolase [Bacteroidota bacterium]